MALTRVVLRSDLILKYVLLPLIMSVLYLHIRYYLTLDHPMGMGIPRLIDSRNVIGTPKELGQYVVGICVKSTGPVS